MCTLKKLQFADAYAFFQKIQRLLYNLLLRSRLSRPIVGWVWPVALVEIVGHKMLLHPADNATEYFMWRRRTRREAASIGRLTLLVSGKRALRFDIGANCGAFTVPLAEASGSGSHINAFEANPTMAARLRKNLELNELSHRVAIHEVAVGANDHDAPLWIGLRNMGASSLRAGADPSITSMQVPVRRLTSFVPKGSQSYDVFVIKCDIEGFEDQALAPFLESVSDGELPDAILIETTGSHLWTCNLRALLKKRGYASLFDGEDQNTLFLRKRG